MRDEGGGPCMVSGQEKGLAYTVLAGEGDPNFALRPEEVIPPSHLPSLSLFCEMGEMIVLSQKSLLTIHCVAGPVLGMQ